MTQNKLYIVTDTGIIYNTPVQVVFNSSFCDTNDLNECMILLQTQTPMHHLKKKMWMCEPNDFLFNLRVFTFRFDRESIISGNFRFAISVCRLRERGRVSKSVYVRVFNDLELLRYVLRCAIE